MLKELLDIGYSKADVVDFALGMDIKVLSQTKYEVENLGSIVIKPKNLRCSCDTFLANVQNLYRITTFVTDDYGFSDRTIACEECANRLKVLEGLDKNRK